MTTATTTTTYGGTGQPVSEPRQLLTDPELGPWLLSDPDVNLHSVDESAPWLFRITWAVSGTGAAAVRVDLRGRHGQPVTPRVWRDIQIGTVLEEARLLLVDLVEMEANLWDKAGYSNMAAQVRSGGESLKPGRGRKARFGPEHWERVATAYNSAVRLSTAAPERFVTDELLRDPVYADDPEFRGLDSATDRRVKGWIARAKKMKGADGRPLIPVKGK